VVARAIDEIPIAAALGAIASGETVIMDASELRVKESDRIAAMSKALRAFGVECEEKEDGMIVRGRASPFEAAEIDSHGDHRIAMASAVLALGAKGPCKILDCDNIATSFPKFVGTLRALGARIDVE
jgi:3-phosphoshikimate 1-carboxyvinyltransferase